MRGVAFRVAGERRGATAPMPTSHFEFKNLKLKGAYGFGGAGEVFVWSFDLSIASTERMREPALNCL